MSTDYATSGPQARKLAGVEDLRPGVDYEEGEQCARCGSSVYDEECYQCDGEGGWFDDLDGDGERWRACWECHGDSRWFVCCSTVEYCEGNPRPGRENVERGEIEHFVIRLGRNIDTEKGANDEV